MLKNTLLSCLFVFSYLFLTAQDTGSFSFKIDPNSKLITYQEVVQEPGTKDELFNRSIYWLNSFYKNPVEVTKVRDQASGIVKGQHVIRIYDIDENGNTINAGTVLYSFKIELKDDRYRYTIDNFLLKQVSRFELERWLDTTNPDYAQKWVKYLGQIDSFMTGELIPSLKQKMKPEVKVEEEEW